MKRFVFACVVSVLVFLVFLMCYDKRASSAPMLEVELIPDLPSGQPVGTTITWNVSVTGSDSVDCRLSVAFEGEPSRVMYDFSPKTTFEWTPIDEGIYGVTASVRDLNSGTRVSTTKSYTIHPRATDQAVVAPTEHPLVAMYSVPPHPSAHKMRVVFKALSARTVCSTGTKLCRPGFSTNFYVGGMVPNSTYAMRHEVLDEDGTPLEYGPILLHQTGTPPIEVPDRALLDPPDFQSSLAEGFLLFSPVPGPLGLPAFPFATSLLGRITWYIIPPGSYILARPVAGGTFLLYGSDSDSDLNDQVLREVDLAGHTLRETTAPRISEQLVALGQDAIGAFHHEARRLPDGHTAVLASVERILDDVQGEGPVDILGDYIVILDEDWQVVWAWNSFDHLDVRRKAILDLKCTSGQLGCPPLFLDVVANDWLHSNAITYSPADGNLLLSMRHQDWIIKIDYRDGSGNGEVIWRLGQEGDFSMESSDPFPWFSHQHDPNYADENHIVVYDNGNTRCRSNPQNCYSRGQVYALDEGSKTATLALNVNLLNYSLAFGSAQPLLNGNFSFNSGIRVQFTPFDFFGTSDEVLPDGTINYSLKIDKRVLYRSFRLRDLYTPPIKPNPS